MSTNGSAHTVAAIELDMRDLLRAKKSRISEGSKDTGTDYSSLVSQISLQSVHVIENRAHPLSSSAASVFTGS